MDNLNNSIVHLKGEPVPVATRSGEEAQTNIDLGTRREELRWFIGAATLILLLSSMPYLAAYLATPDGQVFPGVFGTDNLSYLAKIEMGRRGNWLFHLPYTALAHPGVPLIYTYYLALGHLARVLHAPSDAIFHFVRLFHGYLLLGIVYQLISRVSDEVRERRVAFLVVGLSSGFGLVSQSLGRVYATDINVHEANTFLSLWVSAHYPLSEALLSAALLMVAAYPTRPFRHSALYAGATGLLTLTAPWALATVLGISALYVLLLWRRSGRFPVSLVRQMALATAASVPILGLIWYSLNSDSLLQAWHTYKMLSPPVWNYALGYGLILPAAVLGGRALLKRARGVDQVLVLWIGVSLLFLYLPVSFQRRFSQGLHIPLAILAGVGLHRVILPQIKASRRWFALRAILVLMFATNLGLMVQVTRWSLLHITFDMGLYLSQDEKAALSWLRSHGEPETAILSSTALGIFVPVYSAGRAVSGHRAETVYADIAEAEVYEFFDDSTSPERREAILDKYKVSYVVFGPREAALNASQRRCLAGLTLLFRAGKVEVYEVGRRLRVARR